MTFEVWDLGRQTWICQVFLSHFWMNMLKVLPGFERVQSVFLVDKPTYIQRSLRFVCYIWILSNTTMDTRNNFYTDVTQCQMYTNSKKEQQNITFWSINKAGLFWFIFVPIFTVCIWMDKQLSKKYIFYWAWDKPIYIQHKILGKNIE